MRSLARLLGGAVAVAACVYLVLVAREQASSLPPLAWSVGHLLAVAAATAVYLLVLAAGTMSWGLLLRAAGERIRPRSLLIIMALSQPARYLPGNVGQYVGRVALARRQGLRMAPIVFSLVFETAWVTLTAAVVAGVVFATTGLPAAASHLALPAGWQLLVVVGAAIGLPFVALALFNRWGPRLLASRLPQEPIPPPGRLTFLGCTLWFGLSFLLGGLALDLLAQGLFDHPGSHWWVLTGLFAAAWVAGFLTPGAPGGLGVREVVLLAGLEPTYGAGLALALALALRLVSILGDLLAFAAAYLASRGGRPLDYRGSEG